MCHRGLQYCDLPVISPSKANVEENFLKILQDYPEDEDEILATWEERAKLWDEIDRDSAGRIKACSWAENAYHLITADSC
jgi:hypothetical protein